MREREREREREINIKIQAKSRPNLSLIKIGKYLSRWQHTEIGNRGDVVLLLKPLS